MTTAAAPIGVSLAVDCVAEVRLDALITEGLFAAATVEPLVAVPVEPLVAIITDGLTALVTLDHATGWTACPMTAFRALYSFMTTAAPPFVASLAVESVVLALTTEVLIAAVTVDSLTASVAERLTALFTCEHTVTHAWAASVITTFRTL
jgi:hypothetical protein